MKLLQTIDSKFLFVAFIVMCILWYVKPESGHEQGLKRKDKMHEKSIDSLNLLYIGAMKFANKAKIEKEQALLEVEKAYSERDKARRRTRQAQREYENIKFERTANDSVRWGILTKLYPSLDSLR